MNMNKQLQARLRNELYPTYDYIVWNQSILYVLYYVLLHSGKCNTIPATPTPSLSCMFFPLCHIVSSSFMISLSLSPFYTLSPPIITYTLSIYRSISSYFTIKRFTIIKRRLDLGPVHCPESRVHTAQPFFPDPRIHPNESLYFVQSTRSLRATGYWASLWGCEGPSLPLSVFRTRLVLGQTLSLFRRL